MTTILGSGIIARTRVRHRCWHCGKFIEMGETCYWQTNTLDRVATVYWHDLCHLVVNWEECE